MLELWRAALNAFGVQPEGRRIKQLWVFPVRGCKGASVAVADILPGAGFAVDGMWCSRSADPTRIVEDELTHAISVSVSTTTDGKHKILCLRAQGMPPLSLLTCQRGEMTEQLQLTEGLSNRGLADSGRRHTGLPVDFRVHGAPLRSHPPQPCHHVASSAPGATHARSSAGRLLTRQLPLRVRERGVGYGGRRAPGLMRASARRACAPVRPDGAALAARAVVATGASAPSFAMAPSAEDGRLVRRGSVGADELLYRHDHLQVRLFNPSPPSPSASSSTTYPPPTSSSAHPRARGHVAAGDDHSRGGRAVGAARSAAAAAVADASSRWRRR